MRTVDTALSPSGSSSAGAQVRLPTALAVGIVVARAPSGLCRPPEPCIALEAGITVATRLPSAMNRWATVRLAIAGSTSLLMVATLVIAGVPKSRVGFRGEFAVALVIALLPSAIFAVTGPAQPRVLRWGTIHALLLAALALLYLLGTAGAYGFVYAVLLYFAALMISIVAAVDR